MDKNINNLKPIIKWAGGKTKIYPQLEKKLPYELFNGNIKNYYEPFFGGGAVFFNIIQKVNFEKCIVSDINEELILFYNVVKNDPIKMILFVTKYYKEYMHLSEIDKEKYYYDLRRTYNFERFNISYNDYSYLFIPRAAQLLFLNRTCYNGLFRQNLRGEFNVPFGKNYSPPLIDENGIIEISKILKKVDIKCDDFQNICKEIEGSNSFVYFDPPYKPISKNGGFTNYHRSNFTLKDQLRLLRTFNELNSKNVKIMMNNSHINNDIKIDSIESYYECYNIDFIKSSSTMSSKVEYRKKINELVITNY
jgi:DNA adenine methylase